jgi:hypothetical protein
MGLDLAAPLKWREHLLSAGFGEIYMQWYNWPVGPWAKHKKNKVLGKLTFVDFFEGLSSAGPLFQRFLNWSSEETQVRIAEVKNEMKEQKIHLYQRICVCYAKKPGLLPAENSRTAFSETATLPGPAPPPQPDDIHMVVPTTAQETIPRAVPKAVSTTAPEAIPKAGPEAVQKTASETVPTPYLEISTREAPR